MTEIILYISTIIFACFLIPAVIRKIRWRKLKSSTTVIPVYKKPAFKMYEIGALIDGKIHDRDFIATLTNNILNPELEMDILEAALNRSMGNRKSLIKLISLMKKDKERDLSESTSKRQYINMVNSKLVRDGYYKYNPDKMRTLAILLLAVSIIFYVAVETVFFQIPIAAIVGNTRYIPIGLLLIPFALFGGFAIFAHSFHQNFKKIAPVRAMLLGYRMFLGRTEFYTVQHDIESYKNILPMLLSLGVHPTHWREILEYTLSVLDDRK